MRLNLNHFRDSQTPSDNQVPLGPTRALRWRWMLRLVCVGRSLADGLSGWSPSSPFQWGPAGWFHSMALDCAVYSTLVNCPLNSTPSFRRVGEDMWARHSAMLEKLSAFSTCQQVHVGCNRLSFFKWFLKSFWKSDFFFHLAYLEGFWALGF